MKAESLHNSQGIFQRSYLHLLVVTPCQLLFAFGRCEKVPHSQPIQDGMHYLLNLLYEGFSHAGSKPGIPRCLKQNARLVSFSLSYLWRFKLGF